MINTLLFPSSYFSVRNVDEDLKAEYDAATETGLLDIILFSYDKWFNEGKNMQFSTAAIPRTLVYVLEFESITGKRKPVK